MLTKFIILAQGHFLRFLGGAQEGGAHHQDPHHRGHRVPPPQPAPPGGGPVRDITVSTLSLSPATDIHYPESCSDILDRIQIGIENEKMLERTIV